MQNLQPPRSNFEASKKGAGHSPRRGDDNVVFAICTVANCDFQPVPVQNVVDVRNMEVNLVVSE